MRAKKFKNALSLFMAFAVGLSCVTPVSFAEDEFTSKREYIERAKKIEQGSNTDQSYEKLQKAIKKAEEDLNAGKTDVELELTVDELNKAIEEFSKTAGVRTPVEDVYKEFKAEIERVKSLKDDEDTFPGAKNTLVTAISTAENDLEQYKDNLESLKESFRRFKISVTEYEEGRYTSVKELEKELQKKDPDIKITSILNIPVMLSKIDGSEFEWNSTLVTPARVYKTNKGYKMILALRRSANPSRIGFLARIYLMQGGNFIQATPISVYSIIDDFNHPTEGLDDSLRGVKYPKEVVIDVEKDAETLPIKVYGSSSKWIGKSEEVTIIKFDWGKSKVEKVVTTELEDLIKDAKKIEKGKKTKSAFMDLQNAINTAENVIKSIKTEEELNNAITTLKDAIKKFKKSTDIKTDNLKKTIEDAKNSLNADKIDEAKKELSDAIKAAEKVLTDFESQDDVNKAEKALKEAIEKFEKSVKKADKQKFESKIAEAENKLSNSKKVKKANDELKKAIDDANEFLKNIVTKTSDELGVAISKIEKAIEEFEKKVKDEDRQKLINLVKKANLILDKPDKYEQEAIEELYNAVGKATNVLRKNDYLQEDYDGAIKTLEEALGKIKEIETEKTYTVKAKLQAVGVSSPPMLDTAMNDVVKVIEKGSKARYELQFKSVKDGAKTVKVTEISAIENGNKQKADKFNNSSSEYNETFVISRNSTNEAKIPLEILTDDKDANGGNPQKFNLVFDWSTKNPQNPQGNKVKLTLVGENITSNPSAGEIEKNTNVTVTVTPESNMKVKSFTVNGVERKSDLINNVFNFRIEENTTIKVEYEEKNPKPAEEKVKLTLVGENISSNPIAGQIKKGEDVIVTVAPASNKEVSLFTVNGTDKKSDLINNQYKVKIEVDTEIKVEYKDKQTSSGGSSGSGSGGSSSSSRDRDRDRDRSSSRDSDRKSSDTITINEEEVAKSAPNINFIDVKNNHWAIDYIRFVVQRGIMVGVDKDRFDPNGKLSRAMLISMLARISKEKVEDAKQVEGIPQNQWYSKDMNWAVNAKIVQKNMDGKYDPTQALTRSEMATIIGRYLEYKAIKLEESKKEISFKDMNNMSEETMKYVNILAKYEIVVGDKTGKFNPDASLTRAETAVVMAKLVKAISK